MGMNEPGCVNVLQAKYRLDCPRDIVTWRQGSS
jgi:hypothetical protein